MPEEAEWSPLEEAEEGQAAEQFMQAAAGEALNLPPWQDLEMTVLE